MTAPMKAVEPSNPYEPLTSEAFYVDREFDCKTQSDYFDFATRYDEYLVGWVAAAQ